MTDQPKPKQEIVLDQYDLWAIEEGRRMRRAQPPAKLPSTEMPANPNVPWGGEIQRPTGENTLEGIPDIKSPVLPPPPGKARILIGMPLLDVKYEQLESFLKFWTELLLTNDPRYEVGYHFMYRKPVHMAEESLVKVAQHNKATHLLLMDDDIYDVRKADLDKLFEADRDVIGGVMYASRFPHAMCVFRRYDREKRVIDMPSDNSIYRLYEVPCLCQKCNAQLSHWDAKFCPLCGFTQDNMIQQADLIPFPFTLIKMSVFDKIKQPWFHCTNAYPTDSWFCDRLLEAGMTAYAHMGVRLNHAGITDETRPHYMQMGMVQTQKAKAIVNITPEQMEIHSNLLLNKMRAVEESVKAKPVFASEGKIAAGEFKDEYTLVSHGT